MRAGVGRPQQRRHIYHQRSGGGSGRSRGGDAKAGAAAKAEREGKKQLRSN